MRLGIQNVRSLHRPGSLNRVATELAKQRLDSEGVWLVRWNNKGNEKSLKYAFFSMEKEMKVINSG
jgi:hypothetical protein